jgi:hypothetical protein
MKVIPSTWAFKCTRFPDGLFRKLKSRFCFCGNTDRIIKALGLEGAWAKKTPAEHGTLPKNASGEPRNKTWSYPSIVGMMLYLSANSRPDITFAVNQCCQYSADPKHSHKITLKRVGRYLVGTCDRGLILNLTEALSIEMYVDANFAGLWGSEDPADPVSVRSCTGFVICIAKCPVLWVSKLQTETALSTMMAEYAALSLWLHATYFHLSNSPLKWVILWAYATPSVSTW